MQAVGPARQSVWELKEERMQRGSKLERFCARLQPRCPSHEGRHLCTGRPTKKQSFNPVLPMPCHGCARTLRRPALGVRACYPQHVGQGALLDAPHAFLQAVQTSDHHLRRGRVNS